MPIYEYICLSCLRYFDVVIFHREVVNPICPRCGSKNVEKRLFFSPSSSKEESNSSEEFNVSEFMHWERPN